MSATAQFRMRARIFTRTEGQGRVQAGACLEQARCHECALRPVPTRVQAQEARPVGGAQRHPGTQRKRDWRTGRQGGRQAPQHARHVQALHFY